MMNLKLRLTKEEGIREGSVANSLTTSYYSSFWSQMSWVWAFRVTCLSVKPKGHVFVKYSEKCKYFIMLEENSKSRYVDMSEVLYAVDFKLHIRKIILASSLVGSQEMVKLSQNAIHLFVYNDTNSHFSLWQSTRQGLMYWALKYKEKYLQQFRAGMSPNL